MQKFQEFNVIIFIVSQIDVDLQVENGGIVPPISVSVDPIPINA